MKTIGLLGGMSWQSTVTYYQMINLRIKKELGGLHSAKILLYSIDFEEIEQLQKLEDWDMSAKLLTKYAQKLELAGADFIVLCTNTMHKIVPYMQKFLSIPILHIAEATAHQLIKDQIQRIALLGTSYTMKQDFYKEKLRVKGIDVIIPNEQDIEIINSIIYDELCLGIIHESSKRKYIQIIEKLIEKGIQGVVLGCTEIGLLIQQQDISLTIYDTTKIHANEAALMALKYKNREVYE